MVVPTKAARLRNWKKRGWGARRATCPYEDRKKRNGLKPLPTILYTIPVGDADLPPATAFRTISVGDTTLCPAKGAGWFIISDSWLVIRVISGQRADRSFSILRKQERIDYHLKVMRRQVSNTRKFPFHSPRRANGNEGWTVMRERTDRTMSYPYICVR